MVTPQGFIFDMDGTLVDNMHYHTRTWLEFFEDLGISISTEELNLQLSGRGNTQIIKWATDNKLPDDRVRQMAEEKEAWYRDLYRPHMTLVPGLDRFLDEAISGNISMAVATSAPKSNIDFILDGLQIRSYFQAIVGAEDVEHSKPHPEMFLRAASRLGLKPGNCLIFEDSLSGVEAANRAGIPMIVLTTSHEDEVFRESAGVIFTTPDFTSFTPEDLLRINTKEYPAD